MAQELFFIICFVGFFLGIAGACISHGYKKAWPMFLISIAFFSGGIILLLQPFLPFIGGYSGKSTYLESFTKNGWESTLSLFVWLALVGVILCAAFVILLFAFNRHERNVARKTQSLETSRTRA